MSLAKVALGLVVVAALAGCSSFSGSGGVAGDPCPPPCPAPCPQPYPDPCPPVCPPTGGLCAVGPTPMDPSGQPPPSANAGEVWCYVRVPAVTRTVSEQVCTVPASCRQEWVPPVTQDVCEQVLVCPESCREIPIAAKYEMVCEQIMVCPSKTEWRKVACEPKSLGEGEQLGECWTLCEIPPVYESRQKQVCVSPASCTQEIIPAKYESRSKTVTVQEGYYKSHEIPAVYETRCHEEVVCPCRWEWRRTSECEVPGICPAPCPVVAPNAPAAGMFGSPDMMGDPMGSPDSMPMPPAPDGYNVPPAGELPPADPFAR